MTKIKVFLVSIFTICSASLFAQVTNATEGVSFYKDFGGNGFRVTLKEGTHYLDKTPLKNAASSYSINGSYSVTFYGKTDADVVTTISPFPVGHAQRLKVKDFSDNNNLKKFNDKVNKVIVTKYVPKK
ncbi:MAG: hypothetical protein IPH58_13850 [Sphingobacteriales bacterium]|jgi:hypothetical protein|nr:hypothetical protein [Sphingobacteriales bacterium]